VVLSMNPNDSQPDPSFAKDYSEVRVTRWEGLWGGLRDWGWRIVLIIFGLFIAVYLASVTVLHQRLTSVGAVELEWGDFALAPFRWEEFREKQGRMLNARGLRNLNLGRYDKAFFELRAGLSRSPREVEPRKLRSPARP